MVGVEKFDVVILGSGMVGLCIAYQIARKSHLSRILILEKEEKVGMHTSGRNSGVLHAGIYYKPNTLKANICVNGAKRLKKWVKDRGLPINECGKVIVAQDINLDHQLDKLLERGSENGAVVELVNDKQLNAIEPLAASSSGRALWSPNTAVVKPIAVLEQLVRELVEIGVEIRTGEKNWNYDAKENVIRLSKDRKIAFQYLFNCCGIYAASVAKQFGIGLNWRIMPFKGLYWEIREASKERLPINTNIYPVPDLDLPFLGVHFTPNAELLKKVFIGPTAIPALGRENYKGVEMIEPKLFVEMAGIMLGQFVKNEGNIRQYTRDQLRLNIKPFMISEAQKLVPSLRSSDIKFSSKVGIRPQLYNTFTQKLEDDFVTLTAKNTTHVLNAISPAFTASFELADLIIRKSSLELN